MKTQIFTDGNKRAYVIFANHNLITHGQRFLVISEEHVPLFKKNFVIPLGMEKGTNFLYSVKYQQNTQKRGSHMSNLNTELMIALLKNESIDEVFRSHLKLL